VRTVHQTAAAKARGALRALLQAYGTRHIKQRLWDVEFAKGRWDCLDRTAGDCVYPYLERYANRGSILDLGCGSGSTGNELDPTAYDHYVGVDISDVAIVKAQERTEENRRTDRNRFRQSDIFSYVPDRSFDVILFRDSIYYVPRRQIKAMLHRYARYLKDGAVFIVRMADGDKYQDIVETIETHFVVVDKHVADDPKAVVLIFRPAVR
jgi:2-polyprenyl-6-hydroxyphenyl methylase/3-demethylubiquinone-9 3-methyltransferase